ncbi:DUF6161 domain-containing protein [Hoeflea poritis]|uniref:DUF6161 domain-containing protein n=1 Tax=Hoeflea poritis TaxID=2993659 RepID=A0ABT4VJK2_9HYPH|nr:DUF6161 domain-containing protein [Hoeflea poritis]MDA4844779.1 DUF6161 domain-containing protein [Hoeflea poritis]
MNDTIEAAWNEASDAELTVRAERVFWEFLSLKMGILHGEGNFESQSLYQRTIMQNHIEFIKSMANWLSTNAVPLDQEIRDTLRNLVDANQLPNLLQQPKVYRDGTLLELDASFITEDVRTAFFVSLDNVFANDGGKRQAIQTVAISFIAAYRHYNPNLTNQIVTPSGSPLETGIRFTNSRLAAFEVAKIVAQDPILPSELSDNRMESLKTDVAECIGIVAELQKQIGGLQTTKKVAEDSLKSIETKSSEIHTKIDKLDGPVNAALEKVNLNEARNLWHKREGQYKSALRLSIILLALSFITFVVFIAFFYQQIWGILLRIETEAITAAGDGSGQIAATISAIGRIAIIGAPFGLYIWMVRLLVRFYTRSLVLLDDARQRLTTMDTYLHLIAENAAEHQDRAILLEALFRRAPGQGPDTTEPASMVDMMNLTLGKSDKT